MKYLLCSDIHLDSKVPVNRVDDFEKTQNRKLNEVILLSQFCNLILQAGDLFNAPIVSNSTLSMIASKLQQTGAFLYTVPGQHDLLFRSYENIYDTAMGVLVSSGLARILGSEPVWIKKGDKNKEDIFIYGCGWGQPLPKPQVSSGTQNILVIHASIGDKKLFPTMELTPAKQFLMDNKYDLILVGDYHYPFHFSFRSSSGKKRQIANTGVLIRRSIAESKNIPRIGVYDTETRNIAWKRIMVEPNVFKEEKGESKKSIEEAAAKILSNLEHSKTISSDYKQGVLLFLKENFETIEKETRELILELLNEAEEAQCA
jgi:DNA repair exonuclease SbcCD nuclease subunit